jgi:hypothetical protein
MNEKQTLKIRDLGLAAALVSLGHDMCATDRDTNGRSYFIFLQTEALERDVNGYWADTLDVKARKYFDDIKMLKSRIYGER